MLYIIAQRIKRFLSRYIPIQKKLAEVECSLEVERLMQTLVAMPAEELKAKFASSSVTLESINQSADQFRANVNILLEAERVRQEIQKVSLSEIRKLNEALVEAQKKWGSGQ